jgi:hypothetical protein
VAYEDDEDRMKIEEKVVGGYVCPEFVFSKNEEKRIYRPWRRGVIVKLLGKRIGYKALETRLKQMWVRKGVISIIDLGNDYYLVAFTHEEDQYGALMDGPWFIYDHYLTVKEWSPNFHPASDTIKEVAVWVRISGLPIEYYDVQILHFIGDRVGKTVKVDKNTWSHERGKYARLCVQVDLTKPLLAMFTIKGRKYNVEYEGLHMLCLTCGKLGHYKEGCPEKAKSPVTHREEGEYRSSVDNQMNELVEGKGDGPWRVVQKQRRGKKTTPLRPTTTTEGRSNTGPEKINATSGNINDESYIAGSRFVSLRDEIPEINASDVEREEVIVKEEEIVEIEREVVNTHEKQGQSSNAKRVKHGATSKKGEGNQEKIMKDPKLAARGKGNFKGKNVTSIKRGIENVLDKMGENMKEKSYKEGPILRPTSDFQKEIQQMEGGESNMLGAEKLNELTDPGMGQKRVQHPNIPRPPNLQALSQKDTVVEPVQVGEMAGDNDLFLDAHESSSTGNVDSDMEVVEETPRLAR